MAVRIDPDITPGDRPEVVAAARVLLGRATADEKRSRLLEQQLWVLTPTELAAATKNKPRRRPTRSQVDEAEHALRDVQATDLMAEFSSHPQGRI